MNINILDFREHFVGGDNSGNPLGAAPIGIGGWHVDQLSPDLVLGEADHPGIVRIRAAGQGTSAFGLSSLSCGNQDAKFVHSSNISRFRAILRFIEPFGDGDLSDEGIYAGFGGASNTYTGGPNLGSECVFFSFRAGVSPKWQATCQNVDPDVGEQWTTVTDTLGDDVALDTWYVLEAVQTAGVWEFFVNGVSIGTVATTIPAATLTPHFRIRTEQIHETGYTIDLDCDEFAYRTETVTPLPGIGGW